MKNLRLPAILSVLLLVSGISTFGQTPAKPVQAPDLASDYVLEVMYYKGSRLAYQRLNNFTIYGAFQMVEGWKPKPGEVRVEGVKIFPLQQPGPTIVRVKLIRGEHWEVEEVVGDYPVSEKTTIAKDMASYGIVPFEMRLVRAPATVAELPTIKNSTKSLIVGVEPATSVLPSFTATVQNSSDKAVIGFTYFTSIGANKKFSGIAKDRMGGILIAPGAVYKRTFPYPTKAVTESTGDVPEAESGLQLNIPAVIFSDGSYEGDPAGALRLRGGKTGEKIQLTRILDLLRSPAAANAALFERKVNELSYKIELGDVKVLATEFPGRSDEDWEWARSAAEVAANDINRSFQGNFGTASSIAPEMFADGVKAAIARCEGLLEALP